MYKSNLHNHLYCELHLYIITVLYLFNSISYHPLINLEQYYRQLWYIVKNKVICTPQTRIKYWPSEYPKSQPACLVIQYIQINIFDYTNNNE